ncbi:MAG: hypothetical protein ACTHN5_22975 [Phycisphaerae bacterium]
MSELPPKMRERSEPLEYRKPERSGWPTFFLFVSILFAVGVGLISGVAALFMVGDSKQWPLGVLFIAGVTVLIFLGVLAKKRLGMSAAVAIILVSVCTFFLMIGVCSKFVPPSFH